jgi:hypothetical protein
MRLWNKWDRWIHPWKLNTKSTDVGSWGVDLRAFSVACLAVLGALLASRVNPEYYRLPCSEFARNVSKSHATEFELRKL